MATFPLILKPSFSYEDHLMHNQYVADINRFSAENEGEFVLQAISIATLFGTIAKFH
jgi:hypothetical protein